MSLVVNGFKGKCNNITLTRRLIRVHVLWNAVSNGKLLLNCNLIYSNDGDHLSLNVDSEIIPNL